jgi:hypothetical protein
MTPCYFKLKMSKIVPSEVYPFINVVTMLSTRHDEGWTNNWISKCDAKGDNILLVCFYADRSYPQTMAVICGVHQQDGFYKRSK